MPARKKAKAKPKAKPQNVPSPQEFLAAAEYRIEGAPEYGWDCYGKGAVFVDIDIPIEIGSAEMVVDITTNQICEMTACDYKAPKKQQAYQWRNPAYRAAFADESRARGFTKAFMSLAWDKVQWVNVPPARILKRVHALVAKTKKKEGRK